ncbi:asl7306 (plasmid) [Nostoc sp. PCC 7120 = FACHB-418]|nr:asl7306 [Nostoc sp. PCC 7120 = FACHB-418]
MVGLSPTSNREFSPNFSDLLSGWISYLRTDYRDSLINESHQLKSFTALTIAQHPPLPLSSGWEQRDFVKSDQNQAIANNFLQY